MTTETDQPDRPAAVGRAPTGLVVVTGAAGGIGSAVVARLLGDGHHVLAVDVDVPDDQPGADLAWVRADLTEPAGRAAVVEATDGDELVGLVHAAGITRDARLVRMEDREVVDVLAVNAQAPLELSLALAGRIVDGGGIVAIASRSHLGNFGQVNYAASKGAMVGTTIALSRSLAPRVRVNAVAPGLIATPMTAAMPDEVYARVTAKVPLGRAGEPVEVASAVSHLLSGEASYTTGQVLYVCGGRSR